jgi:hypothetical protein
VSTGLVLPTQPFEDLLWSEPLEERVEFAPWSSAEVEFRCWFTGTAEDFNYGCEIGFTLPL